MKTLLIAATALSLLGGAAAQAQPHYDRHDQRGHMVAGHNDGRHNDWRRGERLPSQYWHGGYVVTDWRTRHLRPAPRGYHWVRVDNNYVLAGITTGLIADIIASSR